MAAPDYVTWDQVGRFGLAATVLRSFPRADVEAAISAASRRVDSYLRAGSLILPLISWGDDIRECTAVLAAWRLMRTKGGNPSENPSFEALRLDYEDQISWLKGVAAGSVIPGDIEDSSDPVTAPAGDTPRVVSNTQRGWADDGFGDFGPFTGSRR